MQHQAGHFEPAGLAVNRIAADRMADVPHVYPDLVGTSRENPHVQQGCAPPFLQHFPFRDGFPAFRYDSHFFPVCFAAADRRLDPAFRLLHSSFHQGQVMFLHPAFLQHAAQGFLGRVVFRYQHDAGGVLVQPVYDTRTQFPADAAQGIQPSQQRVHQGAVPVPRGRMDDHSRGLDDHRQILVFIQYFQG